MNLIAGCANISAPADGCGWVKPISVAEADRLTTATKRARSGRIAIPSRFTKATRGASGVRKALRPRAVVNTPKGFIDRDGPRDAIYQRYGRGGKQVRLLYALQPRARIPKRFRLYEDAERITRSVSPKLFRKNFSQAIRTARW